MYIKALLIRLHFESAAKFVSVTEIWHDWTMLKHVKVRNLAFQHFTQSFITSWEHLASVRGKARVWHFRLTEQCSWMHHTTGSANYCYSLKKQNTEKQQLILYVVDFIYLNKTLLCILPPPHLFWPHSRWCVNERLQEIGFLFTVLHHL